MDKLEEMRVKANLAIRRLMNVDRILVTVGDAPKSKKEEMNMLLAVHPNYEVTCTDSSSSTVSSMHSA
jgi:hypothetical protein